MDRPLRGLYAVTPDMANTMMLSASVREALRGGATLVQYRNKSLAPHSRMIQARAVLDVCRRNGIPMIVNDDVELAAGIGAEGVHLGRSDGTIADARSRLGEGKIIGASCYNDFELARSAAHGGADYVAFGSFFASSIKPNAVAASLDLLSKAKSALDVPAVAIGGITLSNAAPLLDAGADMLAVITALFGAQDVCLAARQFSQLISSYHARQKQSTV